MKSILAEELVDCIDNALSNFGKTTSQVVFSNFESRFNLKKRDVVSHIAEFEELLDDIFGSGPASSIIKKSILREFADRFQILNLKDQSPESMSLASIVNQILRRVD